MLRPCLRCPARAGIRRRHLAVGASVRNFWNANTVPHSAGYVVLAWRPQRPLPVTHRWSRFAAPLQLQPRTFATASYTVKGAGDSSAQVLFVVGLNEGKFFGPDGAEEGLKLLERVAEHDKAYTVLLGIPDRELASIEQEHAVRDRKLTPKSKIENERFCEFIPIIQAAMLDKRPRRALDRELRVTQGHVAWILWQNPREAVKVYWAWWSRKLYKNAECYRFWSEHFPNSSHGHFNERAELISIRAIEQLVIDRVKRQSSTSVLVVRNDLFSLVVQRMSANLEESAVDRMTSLDFSRDLQERAAELDRKIPDLTSLLVFVYIGVPLLILQQLYLAAEYYVKDTLRDKWEFEESRE